MAVKPMRVFLTNGSGFLTGHVLHTLLKRGHSVVTTAPSNKHRDSIKRSYPELDQDRLRFFVWPRNDRNPAFYRHVVSESPPFDAVIHSPNVPTKGKASVEVDVMHPANSILDLFNFVDEAESINRVVLASFCNAATDLARPEATFSETDWNPVTMDAVHENRRLTRLAQDTYAERAAWDFMQQKKRSFKLSVINAPTMFGPIMHGMMDTSNRRLRKMIRGAPIPVTKEPLYVDVRDIALAHVLAAERPSVAAGQRLFAVAGCFTFAQLAEMTKRLFPELTTRMRLAAEPHKMRVPREAMSHIDSTKIQKALGIKFRPLEETLVDTIRSLVDYHGGDILNPTQAKHKDNHVAKDHVEEDDVEKDDGEKD